jgi:uncharacterized protein (DUF2062 family)
MAEETFWQRRVVAPIVAQLKQGITPEKIALTLSLGCVLGVFPIIGATTALCAVVAWKLKLNQPIIQLTNYLLYPVHLLLLLPFYRAGETLFGKPHLPIFSIGELVHRFKASPLDFFADYGMIGLYGVVVWCLLAVPTAAMFYYLLRGPMRALSAAKERN